MELSNIIVYPIKSSAGIYVKSSRVLSEGLKLDRLFAVINNKGNVLTARDVPSLLKLKTKIVDKAIFLSEYKLSYKENCNENKSYATMFGEKIEVIKLSNHFSRWVSDFLEEEVHVVKLRRKSRYIADKYNSGFCDLVNFSDISPIHLINKASVDDLNKRLGISDKVTIDHFRPNLVIKNALAYVEDSWKQIQINNCVFDVHYKTSRCSVTTLNPETGTKNKQSEPIRALSKYRKQIKGEVCFGIYLIPRELGIINVRDLIKVIK